MPDLKFIAPVGGWALLAALSAPVAAAELSASSASSASSSSVGSVSTSLGASSDGSSKKTNQVAEGEYRILGVAALADKPGMVQLTLQALATPAAEPVLVRLPEAALQRHRLAAGDQVAALHRPYGLELARADDRTAFFLVLEDAWFRELTPHAVNL
jgi:hypothetical protein